MAIYFPEMYCGVGSTLRVKKAFEIEFNDGTQRDYSQNEICIVDEILGYGYNLKEIKDERIFRIMNSSMIDYFEIVNHIPYIENIPENFETLNQVVFKQNFKIDGVIEISKNDTFKHEISQTDKLFHNLYSITNKRLVLRMRDDEFIKYIK